MGHPLPAWCEAHNMIRLIAHDQTQKNFKYLWLELAPSGITVNVICPGLSDTAQPTGHMTDKELYAKKERVPLGRIAQPEDIVGPVLFLASDKASHITGQS